MTIAKRLEKQLLKLFFVSISLGLIVLVISTYVSTNQIREKVISFITTHVKTVSTAEANSKNISEIDREVRRLYEAWKDTQDFDLRVEVLLNDKLVGQAGQLQRFGVLSTGTSKEYTLPSGEALRINMELDLTNQLIFDLMLFASFSIFLAACFYLLKKSLGRTIHEVTSPLEERINWITKTAKNLPESLATTSPRSTSSLTEVVALDHALSNFTKEILGLEKKLKEKGYKEGRVKMAEQLAHTIKGKIGLLQMRIQNSKTLSLEEKSHLLESAIEVSNASRIILKSGSENLIGANSEFTQKIDLGEMLEDLCAQKKELFHRKMVDLKLSLPNQKVYVQSSKVEFEAALSNILDNAFESIPEKGRVTVNTEILGQNILIKISDDGCGIPKEILPKLTKERATFGKENGNGLGLFHSKNTILKSHGSLEIKSNAGIGTDVMIVVPHFIKAVPKNKTIKIKPLQTLVVTDDDEYIHSGVDMMLEDQPKIEIVHLKSVNEFEVWIAENGPGELGERIYWMDYDLKHRALTGFDLICKYGLQFESYLITGMADSPELKQKTTKQNIRLISKDNIPNIFVAKSETLTVKEINL